MAFLFYTGVQIAASADWDLVNHPNELTNASDSTKGIGAVRTITWPTDGGGAGDNPNTVTARVTAMQNAGKYVILCVTPHQNAFGSITPANYAAYIASLISAGCQPDAWEIGNEPGAVGWNATTGPFWPCFIAGAAKAKQLQSAVPRILAAPFSDDGIPSYFSNLSTYFINNGLDIRDYADQWAIHLYAKVPTDATARLTAARTQVDAFTAPSAGGPGVMSAMPVNVTEFGWTAYAPPGTNTTMVAPQGPDTTPGTQAYNLKTQMDFFVANRTSKKIRAACWYFWQDNPNLKTVPTGYYGLKKNTFIESVNSPTAGVKPTPLATSANGYRTAKTTLFAYDSVYDPPASSPPTNVVTGITDTIFETSAKMHGTANPNGKATTVWIDYSTVSGSYPFTAPGAFGYAAGSGTTTLNVGFNVTGLTAGQTYFYRIRAVNADAPPGGVLGTEQSFSTTAPPLPPTVITGSATAVTGIHATLNGIIDPNDVSSGGTLKVDTTTILQDPTILGATVGTAGLTDYYFEYGLTHGGPYTNSTSVLQISGTSALSVSRTITGLVPNNVYYFRLVGVQSPYGPIYGDEHQFSTVVPAPPLQGPPALIPLELSVEIEAADGRIYRWDAEAVDERNRPYEITFATQAGDGFAEASCVLNRPIGLDWPDLALLTTGRFIGADASIAYEGRVAGMPRSVGDGGERIEVSFQGLASSMRDRTFMEIYCMRSTDGWGSPRLAQRKLLMAANHPLDADYTATVDTGSLSFKGTTGKTIPVGSESQLEYIAPSGCKIASMQYRGSQLNAANIESARLFGTDDDSASLMQAWAENIVLTVETSPAVPQLRSATFGNSRPYVGMRMGCTTQHSPLGNVPAHRHFDAVTLYGSHGLTLRGPSANGTSNADPQGVYASDVIKNIVGRFCPRLDASEIVPTDTIISHLIFDTPTTPFDAITLLNGYHLYKLAVWENGLLEWEPADLTSATWRVRHDEDTDISLQGDTTDEFANGITVSYTDVDQRNQVLTPDTYGQLRDDDPDNPANKEGDQLWTNLELSVPVDQKGALALGQAALQEFNRPKSPGTISVNGYLEDSLGNLQPAWRVRYGDTVAITDLPNDQPRLVTATSFSEDGQLQITLEQPSTRIDAVVARLELKASTRGL